MPAPKLRLIIPLVGAAALAAIYIWVYRAGDTLETVAGVNLVLPNTAKTGGRNTVTFSNTEGTKGGRPDLLGEEMKPREIRRNSGNWSRSLAAFEGNLGLSGDDHGSSTSDADKGASSDQLGPPVPLHSSSAHGTGSFGGGGGGGSGGGGGGGGIASGPGTNGGNAPLDFFLNPDDDRDLPRIVILTSDNSDQGNNSTPNASGNNLDADTPITVVTDNGNQIVPLDPNFPGKDSFVGPPTQQVDQGATGSDSTTDDNSTDDPRQDPPSDDRTIHKVPDNTGTLGLVALSILGLAGLRRRIAR